MPSLARPLESMDKCERVGESAETLFDQLAYL